MAALEFADVRGKEVLCPSNTFPATVFAITRAGGRPVFVDCNREDLCASFEDFERKALERRPRAACLVHIGGHVAFDVDRIAELCRAEASSCSRTAPTPTAPAGTAGGPEPGATPGFGRFTRRKRFRPARVECWCPATRSCSSSRAATATTASPITAFTD